MHVHICIDIFHIHIHTVLVLVLVHVHVHVRVPTDWLASRLLRAQGRVMRTVDGRTFYLGRRAQCGETSTCVPPLDEEAEFGAVDDLLSV